MGNCCSAQCCPCFRRRQGYEEVLTSEDYSPGILGSKAKRKTSTELDPVKWAWEQKTLKEKLTKFDKTVTHAAIVSFSDGELRAVWPETFRPSPRGLKDIIKAFNGDVDGVASNGIDLGGTCKVSTPGKLDEGGLIGADGQGGGCTILKTKECLLIVVYSSDPAPTNRLVMEVAEFMAEDNNK